MPTYLIQGCYTSAAVSAMVKEPHDRSVVVRGLIESLGGKMEGFWLAFGEYDFVGIAQVPDAQTAAALSMAASAGGGVHNFKTTELLAWSEAVKALKKAGTAKYRPPTNPTN